MQGPARKIEAARLRSNASCCVMGSHSSPHADGETLWQQHGGQRRRVEVLRNAHRTTRAATGEKTVEIPTIFFFLPAAVCCLVVMYRCTNQDCKSGFRATCKSDRHFSHGDYFGLVGLISWTGARNHRRPPTYQMCTLG
jgi:hypothetical protein